jgi:hypothetical protein
VGSFRTGLPAGACAMSPLPILLVLVLAPAAALAAGEGGGPRVAGVGLSAEVGRTQAMDGSAPTSFLATDLFVALGLGERLDLDLSYGLSARPRRGATQALGLELRAYPSQTLSFALALEASPPGGRDPGTYCLPLPQVRCVDAVEQLRFLAPEARVALSSDPDGYAVGALELSAAATLYQLDYQGPPGDGARLLSVPLQEYRLGLEASLDLDAQVELGMEGAVTLFRGALPGSLEDPLDPEREAPTALPLAPPRYALAPFVTWRPTGGLRVRLRAELAPYHDPCLGHSELASLRLTVLPGAWRLFAQGTLQRDVSPTEPGTLARCGQGVPDPDFVSTSVRTGLEIGF